MPSYRAAVGFVAYVILVLTSIAVAADPDVWKSEGWTKTDFGRARIAWEEVLSGGPPKDGIPAIDTPVFVSVTDADGWLRPTEAVARVEINGDARAYPMQVLTWHEIVNDRVGGVAVTAAGAAVGGLPTVG